MWFLVGGVILIIIIVICGLKCKQEPYKLKSMVNFLSLKQTKHLLNTDFDGYASSLNLANLKACGASDFPDLISKWSGSSMGWSEPLKEKIEQAIKLVQKAIDTRAIYLPPTAKQLTDIEWNLACTLHPYYLDGLPHTRGDIIFLTDKVISQTSVKTLAGILLHEKIHIWQRKFPEDMKAWIAQKGFEATHRVFDDSLERSNPDTDGKVYKDSHGNYLGVKFTSTTPLDLFAVDYSPSKDHPFEQMAHEIQKWIV